MARHLPGDVPRSALGKFGELGRLVVRLWDEVRSGATGDPARHAATHLVGGSDQFPKPPVPLTVLVGGPADQGDGAGFMRQDAQLVVGAAAPSVEVGFDAAAQGVASTALRSDARLTMSLVAMRAFMHHPPRIPIVQAGTAITISENAAGPVISASPADANNILANQVFGG